MSNIKRKIGIALSIVIFSIWMLGFFNSVLAKPENWIEVTRFTGSGSEHYTTNYFTCSHVEWRIRWSYVPDPNYPQLALFSVFTYPQGGNIPIDTIIKSGSSDTSGVSYVHNRAGTFFMEINVANTQSYTIIIEQDVDSIPELPSFYIMPLFFLAILLVAIVCRKKYVAVK